MTQYTLVVTTTVPNPNFDPSRSYYGNAPAMSFTTEHLRVTLDESEFLAVKLALLSEMQPKKDNQEA